MRCAAAIVIFKTRVNTRGVLTSCTDAAGFQIKQLYNGYVMVFGGCVTCTDISKSRGKWKFNVKPYSTRTYAASGCLCSGHNARLLTSTVVEPNYWLFRYFRNLNLKIFLIEQSKINFPYFIVYFVSIVVVSINCLFVIVTIRYDKIK
jgi:hypothetical protein